MALTWTTSSGGKRPGSPGSGSVLESGKPLLEESLPPHAHDLASGAEASGDVVVGETLMCEQDHFGPYDLKVRQRILIGSLCQLCLLAAR